MTDEFSIVDIWTGRFPSKSIFIQYFEEQYADDNAPINRFAADQGVMFYDHDFCEFDFKSHPITSFDKLIEGHSYWKSYVNEAKKEFSAKNNVEINVVILVWGRKILKPSSVDGKDIRLSYLGRFACNSKD